MSRTRLTVLAILSLFLTLLTLPAAAAPTIYELETGTRSGGAVVETDHPGYSGSGFVGGFTDTNKGAAAVTTTVSASAASYSLTLRYANGTGSAKTLSLYVAGVRLRQITLPA